MPQSSPLDAIRAEGEVIKDLKESLETIGAQLTTNQQWIDILQTPGNTVTTKYGPGAEVVLQEKQKKLETQKEEKQRELVRARERLKVLEEKFSNSNMSKAFDFSGQNGRGGLDNRTRREEIWAKKRRGVQGNEGEEHSVIQSNPGSRSSSRSAERPAKTDQELDEEWEKAQESRKPRPKGIVMGKSVDI